MVGVPMLKAERISCSDPKLSDAQTRNFEAIKHSKSYLAQALGVAACRRLLSVRYVRLNDMFRETDVARTEGRLYDALDEFSKPSPLIIDDWRTRQTRWTSSRYWRHGRAGAPP